MPRPRLIFSLLMNDGSFMLSRNFELQDVGGLDWLVDFYSFQALSFSVDELIVVNVERGPKDMRRFCRHLERLGKHCFVPLAAGGGVTKVRDARCLLDSGADKIIVNTAVIDSPDSVRELVGHFGGQSIVASIDYQEMSGKTTTYVMNGSVGTGLSPAEHVARAVGLGCGEILLNSMDRDGTGRGFDCGLLAKIAADTPVPIIASGGAGRYAHFVDVFRSAPVAAAATANLFSFIEDGLVEARSLLRTSGFDLAEWSMASFEKLHSAERAE